MSRNDREAKYRLNREVDNLLDDYFHDTGEYPQKILVSLDRYKELEDVLGTIRHKSQIQFMSVYGELTVELDITQKERIKVK